MRVCVSSHVVNTRVYFFPERVFDRETSNLMDPTYSQVLRPTNPTTSSLKVGLESNTLRDLFGVPEEDPPASGSSRANTSVT